MGHPWSQRRDQGAQVERFREGATDLTTKSQIETLREGEEMRTITPRSSGTRSLALKLATGACLAGGASAVFGLALSTSAGAQGFERFGDSAGAAQTIVLDNIFIFFSAVLVFLMQPGFALVEAGLTRAKNAGNIMMKNLMDVCLGVLVFGLVGWGIAYPGLDGGFFGFAGFGVSGLFDVTDTAVQTAIDDYPLLVGVDFLFQAAFAAAAATIVSGAVAGRTNFKAYIMYTLVITGLIYPIVVSWNWGGGWLSTRSTSFVDFAGSGLVHLTGGVAALMGAIALGPRIGKYGKDGKPRPIPGHSVPLAIVGVFLLFIGWFGFNPGSQLQADLAVPVLGVLTAFAAASGGAAAMLTSWAVQKKPDVSMAGNGVLAGLVAICSGIGDMTAVGTLITGGIAGVIVVLAVLAIERAGVDDPVGAVAVHGVGGFWGLTATGLLHSANGTNGSEESLGLLYGGGASLLATQLIGGLAIIVFVGATAGVLFFGLKAAGILRVSAEEEIAGLDVSEHGSPGYGPDLLGGSGLMAAAGSGAIDITSSKSSAPSDSSKVDV